MSPNPSSAAEIADAERFLPLSHLTCHILFAVAEEPRYGYDIGREVEERSGGTISPSIGSLYLAIQRLQKQGLLEEATGYDDEDSRRRYYRATATGRRVAEAEARRLARLVSTAEERRLLEKGR